MKLAPSVLGALGRAKFIYAPPRFDELNPYSLWEVKPPYVGAPGWECSVYFYWYEYLRRHEGYKHTCLNGGQGTFAEEFKTFGNVHYLNFAEWWGDRFWLFEEDRPVRRLKAAPELNAEGFPLQADKLYLEIDLTAPPSLLFRELRVEIWAQHMAAKEREHRAQSPNALPWDRSTPTSLETRRSTAKFPIETKPVLSTLHEHLMVWDAKSENPEIDNAEIADISGIRVNQVVEGETLASRKALKLPTDKIEKTLRRRKQLAVQRHLRIARQYIENAVKGRFPLRTTR